MDPGRTASVSGSLNPFAMLVGQPGRGRSPSRGILSVPKLPSLAMLEQLSVKSPTWNGTGVSLGPLLHWVVGSVAGATAVDWESRTYQTPWVARTAAGSDAIGKVNCPLPLLML